MSHEDREGSCGSEEGRVVAVPWVCDKVDLGQKFVRGNVDLGRKLRAWQFRVVVSMEVPILDDIQAYGFRVLVSIVRDSFL